MNFFSFADGLCKVAYLSSTAGNWICGILHSHSTHVRSNTGNENHAFVVLQRSQFDFTIRCIFCSLCSVPFFALTTSLYVDSPSLIATGRTAYRQDTPGFGIMQVNLARIRSDTSFFRSPTNYFHFTASASIVGIHHHQQQYRNHSFLLSSAFIHPDPSTLRHQFPPRTHNLSCKIDTVELHL